LDGVGHRGSVERQLSDTASIFSCERESEIGKDCQSGLCSLQE
jgi:hypothetical protein